MGLNLMYVASYEYWIEDLIANMYHNLIVQACTSKAGDSALANEC